MNARIIHKQNVGEGLLDRLAQELPAIIAEVMEVPGGRLALLSPEQVSLEFSPASARDVGMDLRIIVFARSNTPRTATENDRAQAIRNRVLTAIAGVGGECSVDIRLYLMEIGAAQ